MLTLNWAHAMYSYTYRGEPTYLRHIWNVLINEVYQFSGLHKHGIWDIPFIEVSSFQRTLYMEIHVHVHSTLGVGNRGSISPNYITAVTIPTRM